MVDERLRLYAAEAAAAQAQAHDRHPLVPALLAVAEREPRAAVLSAVAAALIAIDPTALTALADEVRARLEPWTATTVNWLAQGLDAPAIIARLAGEGLIAPPAPERLAELTAEWCRRPDAVALVCSLLHGQGRLLIFDCEAGPAPVDHTRLIRELMSLCQPVFAVEALSQQQDEDDPPNADYQVRIAHGGRSLCFTAHNLGGWYDVGAVLAALNRALEVAGRPERFAALHSGDQSCWVTFLPAEPLRRAAAELSIPLEDDPDASRRCGVAFEQLLAQKLGPRRQT